MQLDDLVDDAAAFSTFRAVAHSTPQPSTARTPTKDRSIVTPARTSHGASTARSSSVGRTHAPSSALRSTLPPQLASSSNGAPVTSGVGTFRKNPFLPGSAGGKQEQQGRARDAAESVRSKSGALREKLGDRKFKDDATSRVHAALAPAPTGLSSQDALADMATMPIVNSKPGVSVRDEQGRSVYQLPQGWKAWPDEQLKQGLSPQKTTSELTADAAVFSASKRFDPTLQEASSPSPVSFSHSQSGPFTSAPPAPEPAQSLLMQSFEDALAASRAEVPQVDASRRAWEEAKESVPLLPSAASIRMQHSSAPEKVTVHDDVILTSHPYPTEEHFSAFDPSIAVRERAVREERKAKEKAERDEIEKRLRAEEFQAELLRAARASMPADLLQIVHTPLLPPRTPVAPAGPQHIAGGVYLSDPHHSDHLHSVVPKFHPLQDLEKRKMGKMDHPGMVTSAVVEHGPAAKLPREKQEELLRTYQTLLLQWSFVHAKSQAAFDAQQSKALSDTQLVVLELQRLRQELAMKLLTQGRKAHLQKLDRVLSEQTKIYSVLLPMLEQFDRQYEALSKAVHFGLHRVGLNDVDVTGQGDSPSALTSRPAVGLPPTQTALNVSSRQLSRATALLQPHLSTFLSLEQSARGLVSVLDAEVTELQGLYELVRQAWELEGAERGLRMEDMQRGKEREQELRRRIILPPEMLQQKAMFRF
jgi:hypothetical protein